MKNTWTLETLSALTSAELKNLHENAVRKGAKDLIALCDQVLSTKTIKQPKTAKSLAGHRADEFVAGFHFVCSNDTGVDDLGNGHFWSRTWVVAPAVIEKSIQFGAYIALHENKNTPSYRQGKIERYSVGYRFTVADEFGEPKTAKGIDFFASSTPSSYQWVGDGTGEKGYFWRAIILGNEEIKK